MTKTIFKMEDPKFVKFVSKLYSYTYPFIIGVLALLLLVKGAFVPFLCISISFLVSLPQTSKYIKINRFLKFLICIGFIYLGIYSTILYV